MLLTTLATCAARAPSWQSAALLVAGVLASPVDATATENCIIGGEGEDACPCTLLSGNNLDCISQSIKSIAGVAEGLTVEGSL